MRRGVNFRMTELGARGELRASGRPQSSLLHRPRLRKIRMTFLKVMFAKPFAFLGLKGTEP
jgi:hypothetical protein